MIESGERCLYQLVIKYTMLSVVVSSSNFFLSKMIVLLRINAVFLQTKLKHKVEELFLVFFPSGVLYIRFTMSDIYLRSIIYL